MARLFHERTEVIFQNPSYPKGYYHEKPLEKWLLLPMCAYKVSVPYPRGKALNFFQETILKLLAGGNKSNEDIAEKLLLHIELIELIIDELTNRDLIDSRHSLTPKGHAMLNDDDDSYDLKIGYVFYNYITKTFMDTFISDEELYSTGIRSRKGNRVQFYIDEAVANPVYKEAVIVHADNEETKIQPTAYDIIGILRKHKKRKQMLIPDDVSEVVTLADQEKTKASELPRNLEKVSFLGECRWVYVATNLTLPVDDVVNKSQVQMCYPFGIGFASNILAAVMSLSERENNADVKDVIIGLRKEAYGMTDKQLENTKKEQSEVNIAVRKILSDNIENYPHLYRMLLNVESNYVWIQSLLQKNTGSNYEFVQKKMNDYVVDNYDLVAGILIEVMQRYINFDSGMLIKFPSENSTILSGIAKQVGFTDEENVFERFFTIKKGAIIGANSSGKVDALVAYNLIVAHRTNDHPFYKLAKYVPRFITYLNKLVELRNEGKHGNVIEYNFNTIAAYSIKNMYIASLLLEGLSFNQEHNFNFENERLLNPDRIKVSKNAEIEVERIYTANAKKYSAVLSKLVSLQEEILLKADEYPGRVSEVLEAIFKRICATRLNMYALASIKDYKNPDANNAYLKKMQEYGFEVDSIPYYSLSKLSRTFRNYHNGTLGTLFYAWFFSEETYEDSMLPIAAAKLPLLVKVIEATTIGRGHNGKMDFESIDLDFLKEHVDETINTLLDMMAERNL